VETDVASSVSVERCFDSVLARHGRLDILVNSAGVGQTVAPVSELSDVEWDRVLRVTLTGTFYCCRAAARMMERQESGCIVNLASVNGQNPAALVAAYNAAKAGVISLTRTLALELAAYGVRVNAVSPGPVYTDFNRSVMAQRCRTLGLTEEQMIERIRTAIPLGRWGEATDIANAVAFLCGPQATWITGEVLRVSGGLEGVSAAPPKRSRS
jgi:3-oxoacyl-[acyl-carrier protein] reductase